jgi:hypothetical protein
MTCVVVPTGFHETVSISTLTAQVGRNSPLYFAGGLGICVRQGIEFNPKLVMFKQPQRNRIRILSWIDKIEF